MKKPIKMDDLGVPLFLETPISIENLNCENIAMGHERSLLICVFYLLVGGDVMERMVSKNTISYSHIF